MEHLLTNLFHFRWWFWAGAGDRRRRISGLARCCPKCFCWWRWPTARCKKSSERCCFPVEWSGRWEVWLHGGRNIHALQVKNDLNVTQVMSWSFVQSLYSNHALALFFTFSFWRSFNTTMFLCSVSQNSCITINFLLFFF